VKYRAKDDAGAREGAVRADRENLGEARYEIARQQLNVKIHQQKMGVGALINSPRHEINAATKSEIAERLEDGGPRTKMAQ